MRIISSFKDYYDCIQRDIFDKDTLYIRETKKVISNECRYDIEEYYPVIVGFAGELHVGYRFNLYFTKPFNPCFCWNEEETKAVCDKSKINFYEKPWNTNLAIADMFSALKTKEYQNIFLDYNVPIFYYINPLSRHGRELILNPNLSELEFFRCIEPYTAFQKLYQYICNQASPEKPIPHISDKDMIIAKGFDKFSFRKEKSKVGKKNA